MAAAAEPLPRSFYDRDAESLARDLLGRVLVRRLGRRRLALRIVETEAYLGVKDPASHAWGGRRTPRTRTLYLPGGHAYVYFIYGMYHMFNVVAGGGEPGAAVLVRAGEPVAGRRWMLVHRGLRPPCRGGAIAGGPGKLCQALAIDRRLDGYSLDGGELCITPGEAAPSGAVIAGPRVGVDYAREAARWPLRFAIRGHPDLSRPRLL